MTTRLSLLASVACLSFSLVAHAADISYTITNDPLTPSGSFSGSVLLNTTTSLIDGGSITALVGGNTYSFFNASNNSSIGGLAFFSDAGGDTFRLALDGTNFAPLVNTLANFGTSGDTFFQTAAGARFDATRASLSPTPEPSSLLLLGTGALGLADAFRRRFMNA